MHHWVLLHKMYETNTIENMTVPKLELTTRRSILKRMLLAAVYLYNVSRFFI